MRSIKPANCLLISFSEPHFLLMMVDSNLKLLQSFPIKFSSLIDAGNFFQKMIKIILIFIRYVVWTLFWHKCYAHNHSGHRYVVDCKVILKLQFGSNIYPIRLEKVECWLKKKILCLSMKPQICKKQPQNHFNLIVTYSDFCNKIFFLKRHYKQKCAYCVLLIGRCLVCNYFL